MTTQENKYHYVSLLDYWRVIWKYKRSIIAIVACASLVAVIVSLILPKTFRAEAVVIPVSSKGGGFGGLASQFGNLASIAGISVSGAVGDDAAKIKAILKSRTLAENVIVREKMMPILFAGGVAEENRNMELAVKKIKEHVNITEDKKNGLIKIGGIFKEPATAARVVNAYLDELQKFINANAFTTAKRNRIFIGGQLEQNKSAFLELGKDLSEFYKTNRISSVEADVDVAIGDLIKAGKVTDKGAEYFAKLDVQAEEVLKTDVGGLMAQKAELSKRIDQAKVVRDVPQQVYLAYLMMQRSLLAELNALLTTQFEMAKIEETKEDLAFQVIDNAVVPIKRFKPKRGRICVVSFMVALFFAVFLAFIREYLKRTKMQEY